MKLVTKKLEERFSEVGSQANVDDPIIIAKFFNPVGAGTWYATEYWREERVIFGYTSIDELESLKLPVGLGIERDIYWEEKPFSETHLD